MKTMYKTSFLMMIAIIIIAWNTKSQTPGKFTDPRDGKIYKTVKIGKQIWIAENLTFKTDNGCWAYDNQQRNFETYGYLYDWNTAQKVCPSGWHLPSDKEWQILIQFSGGIDVAGGKLKAQNLWNSPNTDATDRFGFSALPGGQREMNDFFCFIGSRGFWWTADEYNPRFAWYCGMICLTAVIEQNDESKYIGLSVRCIKDQ